MAVSGRASVATLAGGALLLAACGSRSALYVPRADGGTAPPCVAGDASPETEQDAGLCTGTAMPASGRVSPASGTVAGPGFTTVLCASGAHADIDSTLPDYDTVPALFQLSSTPSAATGSANGTLTVSVGIPVLGPGEYDSADPGACGILDFTYWLPTPCVSCGGVEHPGGPADCPPGCSTVCSHFGCLPCAPKGQSVSYGAIGPTTCISSDSPGSGAGSWHVSLTSIDPPHGRFRATLVADGLDAGPAPGTVTVTAMF